MSDGGVDALLDDREGVTGLELPRIRSSFGRESFARWRCRGERCRGPERTGGRPTSVPYVGNTCGPLTVPPALQGMLADATGYPLPPITSAAGRRPRYTVILDRALRVPVPTVTHGN